MLNERVLSREDLAARFHNERDLVTYSPYEVGDRVVRCGHCHCVVKTEFIISNQCPLCGSMPFLPVPVIPEEELRANSRISTEKNLVDIRRESEESPGRSLSIFLCLMIISAVIAPMLTLLPDPELLSEVAFGLPPEAVFICVALISCIAAFVIYNCDSCRDAWEKGEGGGLLTLVPVSAPYLILLCIWVVTLLTVFLLGLALIAFGLVIVASWFK